MLLLAFNKSNMKTEELFKMALGISNPWYVTEIKFNVEGKQLDIFIDFKVGSTFSYEDEDGKTYENCKPYDTVEKKWRHLNFFQHECYLHARVPRIQTPNGKVRLVSTPWEGKNTGFTLLFEAMILQLLSYMPVHHLGKIIGESDPKIWRVIEAYVEEAREQEDFSEVTAIGVDETASKRGHNYISLFVDLTKRRTIFITEGKGHKVVEDFCEDLAKHKGTAEAITDVSCDMSPAFIKGVKENLPKAEITFDKFHILKIINHAVDCVRKEEAHNTPLLKRTRYIFLKNEANLKPYERKKLEEIRLSKLNLKSLRALHIREAFQAIYKADTETDFKALLDEWYFRATHSQIPQMTVAAKTIKVHRDGVVNWKRSQINNGILEGLNSVVQSAKARARGFRTTRYFIIIAYLVTAKLDFSKINPFCQPT